MRVPPCPLNPPMAMTGTPAVSSSDAADTEPNVAAAHRYEEARDARAASRAALAVTAPPWPAPPPAPGPARPEGAEPDGGPPVPVGGPPVPDGNPVDPPGSEGRPPDEPPGSPPGAAPRAPPGPPVIVAVDTGPADGMLPVRGVVMVVAV